MSSKPANEFECEQHIGIVETNCESQKFLSVFLRDICMEASQHCFFSFFLEILIFNIFLSFGLKSQRMNYIPHTSWQMEGASPESQSKILYQYMAGMMMYFPRMKRAVNKSALFMTHTHTHTKPKQNCIFRYPDSFPRRQLSFAFEIHQSLPHNGHF